MYLFGPAVHYVPSGWSSTGHFGPTVAVMQIRDKSSYSNQSPLDICHDMCHYVAVCLVFICCNSSMNATSVTPILYALSAALCH